MARRPILAAAVLAAALAGVGLVPTGRQAHGDDPKPAQPPQARVLPGLKAGGFVQLPNQWRLAPAGKHLEVGDLPVHVEFHPTGQFAAVLHCGMREHEIVVLDCNAKGRTIVSRAAIPQAFYGLCFSPDGRQLYASGGEFDVVRVFDFERGHLSKPRTIEASLGRRTVPCGLAIDPSGKDLFVTALWGDALMRIPLENPANPVVISLAAKPKAGGAGGEAGAPPSPPDGRRVPKKKGDAAPKLVEDDFGGTRPVEGNGYPYAVLIDPKGARAYVSLWAKSAVAAIDLATNEVAAVYPTEAHPTEMALAPDGKALYVACANSTKVSVIDPAGGEVLQTIHAAMYPTPLAGNTPNSLCLTPDGQLLFVANADANNLAVFNVADRKTAKPLGFIPTGWYPTSVRYNPADKTITVANGKGVMSQANRTGPNPDEGSLDRTLTEYIGTLLRGTVSTMGVPSPAGMAKLTKTAYECSPAKADGAPKTAGRAEGNPVPAKVGDQSPIKYVMYIVKENRTYDQVFGDMPEGNGEKELCLFPDAVTPNHHRLARDYVLLDNTYCDGEVSADGHEWSMGAYATDFVEKLWPLSYRGSPTKTFGYPSEGAVDAAARPAGGYLWDRAKEACVSYRNYGEWVTNGTRKPEGGFNPGVASTPSLVGHIDPEYRGYDLDTPDTDRAKRFLSELARFEKEGDMPRLQILRISNDHTSGTRVGKPTPTAQVADNDLALGMVVEGVSKSKFWAETAIFVIEDDAQNGPDHVDAHRTVALAISPYTKGRGVDSTLYSTTSLLRTMELILGLKPMSQFDAAARPMYNSFTSKPDAAPYSAIQPKTDLKAVNEATAWGAERSAKFDLTKEDLADDLLFNEVIWKSVKGAKSRMPAPVRAAFFLPVKRD